MPNNRIYIVIIINNALKIFFYIKINLLKWINFIFKQMYKF